MKKLEKELEDLIVDKYLNGVSNQVLSSTLNLNRGTIQRVLKRNNVKLHKNRSALVCNEKFFDEYTKESCYWAGFILADGYLRKDSPTLHIKLSKKDREHLYNFLKCIDCEKDIVKKYLDCCYIDICKENIYYSLNKNFEIYSKKTFTSKISSKIPEKYILDFIRGYFDGDGSITGKKYTRINFIGTQQTLNYITDYFFNKNIKIKTSKKNSTGKPPIHKVNGSEIIGIISYGCKNAESILKLLYQVSDQKTRLKRKYELFKSKV